MKTDWEVRLAEAADYTAVRDMSKTNHEESCPHRVWNEERMYETFHIDYLANSSCIIFVVTKGEEVVGFLLTGIYAYRAFDGLFTTQEVLFVRPDRRGTRAAALLMRKLVDWSVSVGACEIVGGNDNEVHSEQTARFLSRFGFKQYGYAMKRELKHGR